ncbi:alkylphosphonate utilization protein [Streptomyces sp. NPDC004244]|uniref:alkylphosphonate utilization protein n=1 Tax=Streptomyces sp. NPDC101206 TaxID=3366128 RepID=UPI0037FC96CB
MDGDSGTLIKDLKVEGTSESLKRGTLVKNIRVTSRPGEIECNANKVKGLVLKTQFLRKALPPARTPAGCRTARSTGADRPDRARRVSTSCRNLQL